MRALTLASLLQNPALDCKDSVMGEPAKKLDEKESSADIGTPAYRLAKQYELVAIQTLIDILEDPTCSVPYRQGAAKTILEICGVIGPNAAPPPAPKVTERVIYMVDAGKAEKELEQRVQARVAARRGT